MEKWPYIYFGDLEAALIQIIQEAPEIIAFPGGAPRVSTTLKDYTVGDRWITVNQEGGSLDRPIINRARVDFNVFGPSRSVAHDLAQTAFAVLFREMGQPSPDFGLRTLGIRVETGLTRADDKLNDSARFLFALRISYVPYTS